MKLILITQNDPFYLPKNLRRFVKTLPDSMEVVGAVNFEVSPFGKRESFMKKAYKTLCVFGPQFFVHYAFRYLGHFFSRNMDINSLFAEHNIPLISLKYGINHSDSLAILKEFNADILVSIAGNQIFKKPLIDLAPKGIINLHTALLPKYRGLMPSFWVLKNEEKTTGVSVFFVDEGIDSGPIIIQKEVNIGDMSLEKLIKHTKYLGIDALIEALICIETGKVSLIENDISKGSYFTFPSRTDVRDFYRIGKKFF